jgi:hypothetical protein
MFFLRAITFWLLIRTFIRSADTSAIDTDVKRVATDRTKNLQLVAGAASITSKAIVEFSLFGIANQFCLSVFYF